MQDPSVIQSLLDEEARLSNEGLGYSPERKVIHVKLVDLRGEEPPHCWGDDDCSTMIMVRCPWRIDCG